MTTGPIPDPVPTRDIDPGTPGPPPVGPSEVPPAGRGRLPGLALVAGLLAGLASWAIGEGLLNAIRPPYVVSVNFGRTVLTAHPRDQMIADRNNAFLAYGALGSLLGLALGTAGGLARGSARSAATAAGFGAIAGAALAVAAAAAALPFYFRASDVAPEELSRDVVLPLLVHLGAWSACGLAGGLALGVGLGLEGREGRARAIKAAIGGTIGAALGAVVYEVSGSLIFYTARTNEPISRTWASRLVARMAVAVLASLLAAAVAEGRRDVTKAGPTRA